MTDLNNNVAPSVEPMNVPMQPIQPIQDSANVPIQPVQPVQPMQQPMNVPIQPVQPVQPMLQPMQQPMNAPMQSMEQPLSYLNEPIPDPLPPLNYEGEKRDSVDSSSDSKFKEKIRNFENFVMEVHKLYMNLPDKIGIYAYDKLLVNADRILTDYSDYITPNVEYMVENMKKKLEILNPKGGVAQKGKQVLDKFKEYLKNFTNEATKFSQFKKNNKKWNESFNVVLAKLIENLKTGTKDEITTLVKLLRKLIEEMMKTHSTDDGLKPEDFLERIKNLAMRPIQIIRGKGDEDVVAKQTVPNMDKLGEAGANVNENITLNTQSPKYNVGLDTQLTNAVKNNQKDREIEEITLEIQELKKERRETEEQRKQREKTYKENVYEHLEERVNLLIGILKEKINNFDGIKDKMDDIKVIRYVYDELNDRIRTNIYSTKFSTQETNYLKRIKAKGDELFNNFLNKVIAQKQKERVIVQKDCDDKGLEKLFKYNYDLLETLKKEGKVDIFNKLKDEITKKLNTEKVEIEKLPNANPKKGEKLLMIYNSLEQLRNLKAINYSNDGSGNLSTEVVRNAKAKQAETERLAKQAEEERLAKAKTEEERIAAEQAEAEAKEKAAEQAEAERVETERLANEKTEAERAEAERAETERLARERAEAERLRKKVGEYSPIEKCYSYHDLYCLLGKLPNIST
jgi:hypothetical protein